MCGIAFSLHKSSATSIDTLFSALVQAVAPRGPDTQGSHTENVDNGSGHVFEMRFHAAVLHLRGDAIAHQPFQKKGNVLIYNGEIFDGLDVSSHDNDGQTLFDSFQAEGGVIPILRLIEGPYSFVYYEASTSTIYWGRDPLGRRSLMVHEPTKAQPHLLLASIVPPDLRKSMHWKEVETSCVFACHISSITSFPNLLPTVRRYERLHYSEALTVPDALAYPFDPLNKRVPKAEDLLSIGGNGSPTPNEAFCEALAGLQEQLGIAVRKRVADVPRLQGPQFPAARIAVLFSGGLDCTVLAALAHKFMHPDESIDLLNVAFENPRSLANAAKQKAQLPVDTYTTPDRLTGLASYRELCEICPHRKWNFVQVNVPHAEFMDERQRIIDLMQPNNTIMDLSIVQALYFAARGKGFLGEPDGALQAYTSEARVLLSGLGADEQLGGYSRHKKAFARWESGVKKVEDWDRLLQELQMDLDRIGTRNLGRDDRIISSLGKEVRYPYLAGHVIAYLAALPVQLKMDHRFGDGVGDKMLLRTLARELGLAGAAGFAKRAIQFGARSAKMELDSSDAKGDTILL